MRIVFFGTSNVALPILESLSRKFDILAVVTSPDAPVGRSQALTESPVSVLAKEMNLPLFKPEKVKGNIEFAEQLKVLNADIFVVVSYGKILPLPIINLPKFKTINVHFSLLPKYRGASPIQSALLNGETQSGVSIFILDELVDHGPILATLKINIDSDDNALSLSQKMAFASAELIVPTIDGYTSGTIQPQEQNHAQATYTTHIDKAQGKIDWSKTAQTIYNQFRAFYPWPGVWTVWQGKKVKILDCIINTDLRTVSGSADNYGCGQVLDGGIVACGDNTFLQIKTLQIEGKKATKISDFLHGNQEFINSVLG
jgi:methionyl-tRNA formyltransferase